MSYLKHGLLIETRRVGRLPGDRSRHIVPAPAVDLRCVVAVATTLSVAQTGCTWVELGFDTNYPYGNGRRPSIVVGSAALTPVLGVLVHDQLGSGAAGILAAGDLVWVRVGGVHPYALLKGDGTNVTTNLTLMGAASGLAVALTTSGIACGTYVGADTVTAAAGVGPVLLGDPLGLLAGM